MTASGPIVPNLDPTLIGSIGFNRNNRPQTNTFITGTNANISSSTLGDLRLQKGFLLGGVASVGVDSTRLNTNNLRADVNPATNAGLAATFVQPLLRGFGLAVNNRYIRIAKNNRNVSDLVFEQQVVSTAYTVARLYWDLVAIRSDANVQQESLDLAQRLLAENLQQEQAGTLAPIEVTSTRAAVASVRRNLTVAQTRLRQQETVLKDYLTRGSVDSPALSALRIIPTDTMTLPAQEAIEPLQDLVAEARKKRPEIAQADIQVDNSRITATGSRSALLPSLDLVASARSNALFGAINPVPPLVLNRRYGGAPTRSDLRRWDRNGVVATFRRSLSRLQRRGAVEHPDSESRCAIRLHARPVGHSPAGTSFAAARKAGQRRSGECVDCR